MSLRRVLLQGTALRLLPLVFPDVYHAALACVESLTPPISWRTLAEQAYYATANVHPYDGGADLLPPLLVAALGLVIRIVPWILLSAALEVHTARRIVSIARWYHKRHSASVPWTSDSDAWIASFYMYNPLLLVSSLLASIFPILSLLVTELVYQVLVRRNIVRASLLLAVASYLSLRLSLLIVPIAGIFLCHSSVSSTVSGIASYFGAFLSLLVASYGITGSWAFLDACYGQVLRFTRIQPNVGLWWYLFLEMFDFFSPFYRILFNIFGALPIVPITIRLYEYSKVTGDSFVAFIICLLWLGLTHPYPCVGDFGYVLALVPILQNTAVARTRYAAPIAVAIGVSGVLLPIFYYCWIVLGTGNSNFFYSLNLAWALAQAALMADLTWSQLIFDYERSHGVKGVRLSQI